jgi:hypothetical protein
MCTHLSLLLELSSTRFALLLLALALLQKRLGDENIIMGWYAPIIPKKSCQNGLVNTNVYIPRRELQLGAAFSTGDELDDVN